jgi:ketosteroid isomerase-like protein
MNVLLTVLLAAAASGASGAKAGVATARAAVRQADVDMARAVAARDLDRFLSFLADDVSFFPDGAPIAKGKPAVRVLWAPFFEAQGPALSWTPATVEVAASGDLAYTTGTFEMKGTDAQGKATHEYGKYVTIWRKRPDGWKVAVDIGNSEPPPERDFGPPPLP